MKYKAPKAAIWAARLCGALMKNEFQFPKPVQGKYSITDSKKEKLKWAYKCWVKQIEVAEKDSYIEEYFAMQKLRFGRPAEFETIANASISAGGDLMAVDCLTPESCKNFFRDVQDFYFDADLTCANLETTITDSGPVGRSQVIGHAPRMNTSEDMMDIYQNRGKGIDYFSTANNHCYDYGEQGLLDTLDCLDRRGALHSGTNRSQEEQDSVLIVEKNGIRIALLSYTLDTNGNVYDKSYLVNEVRFNDEYPNLRLVERQVIKAKEQKADFIVVSAHWGWEFEMYPHKNIIQVAHNICDMGVDMILGSHPHVSQPMERYAGSSGKNSLIVYSLGDFMSYHPLSKNSKLTYIVRCTIEKGIHKSKSKVLITDLKVMPVYIFCEEKDEETYDCRLVPFQLILDDHNSGKHFYQLTQSERKDLKRLKTKVWDSILMPKDTEGIIKF